MATSAKKTTKRSAAPETQDATALLHADHEHVTELFAQYETARSTSKKMQLVSEICAELTVHAQVEEEIFYPAVQRALKDKDLVPEATVEHASLKELISQVEGVQPDGEMFDAKIKVLSEYVEHHVKEEEEELFPQAESSRLDMAELGTRMFQRKQELVAQRA